MMVASKASTMVVMMDGSMVDLMVVMMAD